MFPQPLEPHNNFKVILSVNKLHPTPGNCSAYMLLTQWLRDMPLKLILKYLVLILSHPNCIKYTFLILWISFSFRVEIQWHRKQTCAASENCWRHHVMNSITPDFLGWSNLLTSVKTPKLIICGEQVCWNIMVKIWLFVCTTNKCLITSSGNMQTKYVVYWRFIDEKPKNQKGSPSIWCSKLKQKISMFSQVVCFVVNGYLFTKTSSMQVHETQRWRRVQWMTLMKTLWMMQCTKCIRHQQNVSMQVWNWLACV